MLQLKKHKSDHLNSFRKNNVLFKINGKLFYNFPINTYIKLFYNYYYYELRKNRIGVQNVYSYLSEILHKKNIKLWLINRNLSEQSLVDQLKEKFKIDLELFDTSFYNNIETENFSVIEKMFIIRVNIIAKRVKDDLSNHVHLNIKYAIGLNPYIFSFTSNYVYHVITSTITSRYQM